MAKARDLLLHTVSVEGQYLDKTGEKLEDGIRAWFRRNSHSEVISISQSFVRFDGVIAGRALIAYSEPTKVGASD